MKQYVIRFLKDCGKYKAGHVEECTLLEVFNMIESISALDGEFVIAKVTILCHMS